MGTSSIMSITVWESSFHSSSSWLFLNKELLHRSSWKGPYHSNRARPSAATGMSMG